MKPVVIEKHDFLNQDFTLLTAFSSIIDVSGFRQLEKLNVFLTEWSTSSKKGLNKNLVQEVKKVVIWNNAREIQVRSKLLTLFGLSGQPSFQRKVQDWWFFSKAE